MRWEVEFTTSAYRSLRKLDRPLRESIAAGIQRLAEELASGKTQLTGATKLVGWQASRLRVADYRVVFRTEERRALADPASAAVDAPFEPIAYLVIERIGHRREVYRT